MASIRLRRVSFLGHADHPPQHLLLGARRERVPVTARRGRHRGRPRARLVRGGPRPGRTSSTTRSLLGAAATRPASVISPAASISATRWRSSVSTRSGPARRHQLQGAFVVEHVHRGVDPAEADRLLHRVGIRAARPARRRAPRAQPHAACESWLARSSRATGPRLGMEDRQVELPRGRVVRRRRCNGRRHRPDRTRRRGVAPPMSSADVGRPDRHGNIRPDSRRWIRRLVLASGRRATRARSDTTRWRSTCRGVTSRRRSVTSPTSWSAPSPPAAPAERPTPSWSSSPSRSAASSVPSCAPASDPTCW